MSELKLLPKGLQSFEELRDRNSIYVDKTDLIYKIIREEKYAFLSRPRRFGKSLLISTLKAFFEGRKDLFEGLKISSFEKVWKKYPIIRLDFTGKNYKSIDALTDVLDTKLAKYEKYYGIEKSNKGVDERFTILIEEIYNKTGEKVVILVDEYDKPLLECPKKYLSRVKATFKSFFGNLKNCDEYIRFGFFTGVTKFTKISIFSDLNNLTDLTLDKAYSTLCGITEVELLENFKPYIERLAAEYNLSFDDCVKRLKEMYDGYHFSRNSIGVYNPYSLINCFSHLEFGYYWFETGTPSFIIEKLKKEQYDLSEFLNGTDISADILLSYDVDPSNEKSILYQAGYLTIDSYDDDSEMYTLKYPNKEVESAFVKFARRSIFKQGNDIDILIKTLRLNLISGDVNALINTLNVILSGVPYPNKKLSEDVFRNYLYLIFKVIGNDITCEGYTSRGRTDAVLTNKEYIYIIELKIDKSAEEAMNQINDKGYADKWALDKRKIIKLGINYSNKDRKIDSFLVC